MRRDLIGDRYGRFYELPVQLSQLGDNVCLACISYASRNTISLRDNYLLGGRVKVASHNLIPGLPQYIADVGKLISEARPDCILACSDAFQVIIGAALGRKWRLPVIADLYDNFESYNATKFPGVRFLFHRALANMDGVVCISEPLRDKVTQVSDSPKLVLENAVDTRRFRLLDRKASRADFGLPQTATIIGTTGLIHHDKDIKTLLEAYSLVRSKIESCILVLAGPFEESLRSVLPAGVILLGDLDYSRIPSLISCFDVGVVSVKDNDFGRYCFPQKACEFVAAGIPIVAADIGALSRQLADTPDSLYKPGVAEDLARALSHQIRNRELPKWRVASWREQAEKLQSFIHECVGKK